MKLFHCQGIRSQYSSLIVSNRLIFKGEMQSPAEALMYQMEAVKKGAKELPSLLEQKEAFGKKLQVVRGNITKARKILGKINDEFDDKGALDKIERKLQVLETTFNEKQKKVAGGTRERSADALGAAISKIG